MASPFPVLGSEPVDVSGSRSFRSVDGTTVFLVVNITQPPTDPLATIQFTMAEVDPSDRSTSLSTPISTPVLTGVGVTRVVLRDVTSPTLLVSWTVTALFPEVSATVYGATARDEITQATFLTTFSSIDVDNTFMAALSNTTDTRIVVVQRIWIFSTSVTEVDLAHGSGVTDGTPTTPRSVDSNDVLSSGITAVVSPSGATIDFQVPLHFGSVTDPLVYERKTGTRGHVLRTNESLILTQTTPAPNPITIMIEFTDEPV